MNKVLWDSNPDLDCEALRKESYDADDSDEYIYNCEANSMQEDFEYLLGELDISLECPIIVIADLGFWHGRRPGFKDLHSDNIKRCLMLHASGGYERAIYYLDRYNLRADLIHYDSSHHVTFRVLRNAKDLGLVERLAINGNLTSKMLSRYTQSIKPFVDRAMGF